MEDNTLEGISFYYRNQPNEPLHCGIPQNGLFGQVIEILREFVWDEKIVSGDTVWMVSADCPVDATFILLEDQAFYKIYRANRNHNRFHNAPPFSAVPNSPEPVHA